MAENTFQMSYGQLKNYFIEYLKNLCLNVDSYSSDYPNYMRSGWKGQLTTRKWYVDTLGQHYDTGGVI